MAPLIKQNVVWVVLDMDDIPISEAAASGAEISVNPVRLFVSL
jgi:hypothetical protein